MADLHSPPKLFIPLSTRKGIQYGNISYSLLFNSLPYNPEDSIEEGIGKKNWKKGKMLKCCQSTSPFLLYQRGILILLFSLTSANAFNVVKSSSLSFVKASK